MAAVQPKILCLLRQKLCDLVLSDTIKPKSLVCVTKDELLGNCLPLIDIQQMSLTNPNGITTLLVGPSKCGEGLDDESQVVLLDAREIVTVLYSYIRENETVNSDHLLQSFLSLSMGDIVEKAPKLDSLKFVEWTSNLASVLGEFGGSKRVIITEKKNGKQNMKFVFSVKDFILLLDEHGLMKELSEDKSSEMGASLLSLGSTLKKPLSLLTGDPSRLCCVMKEDPALQTLHKIAVTHHRGLPVVGRLVEGVKSGNASNGVLAIVSTSDFVTYLLHADQFALAGVDLLSSSTIQFASLSKQIVCLQATSPCITMGVENTLYETLQKMKSCKVHRLLLSDEKGDICGLISTSDIGKLIASEMHAIFDEGLI